MESDGEGEIDYDQLDQEILKYKQMVKENPNDYDAHKNLIKNLRVIQDFDNLKQARLDFAKELSLEQEVWLEWLSDEKQLVSTEKEKMEVIELYCRAVKDYNAIDIWVDFLEFLIQEFQDEDWISENDARKYCKKAIEMVESNFEEGHLVWNIVKDFEILLLERGLKQPEDVRKFFLDRLKRPHQDLENTFGAYSSFESNFGDSEYAERMRNASKLVTLTRKLNEKRELKEEKLRESEYSLDSYFDYIDTLKREFFKKKNLELVEEIKSLFWRAIKIHFWDPTIWISYLGFLLDGNEADMDYLVFLVTRAIKNSSSCLVSPELWVCKILVEEKQSSSFGGENDTFLNAVGIMESVGNYKGLNKILMARVSSGIRTLTTEKLKAVYEEAMSIQKRIPGNTDISVTKAFAFYQAQKLKNFGSANEILSKAVKSSLLLEDWLDWIAISNLEGNIDKTRDIFRLASRRPIESGAEIIYTSWLSFEERFGNLKSYLAAFSAIFDLRRRDAKALKELDALNGSTEDAAESGLKSKKRDREENNPTIAKKQKRMLTFNPGQDNKKFGDISTYKVIANANAGNMVFLTNLPIQVNREMLLSHFKTYGTVTDIHLYPNEDSGEIEALVEFQKAEVVRKIVLDGPFKIDGTEITPRRCRPEFLKWSFDNDEKKNTIYVKNLPGANVVNKMMIRDHFSQYGKIKDIRLQSKPTYSYAYIIFDLEEEAKKSLVADQSAILPNRIIGVAISNPAKKTVHEVDKKQLYISNLPNSVVEVDLEQFFKSCGKIEQVRLSKGQGKVGYAFVHFYDEESARKGLQLNGQTLDNHVLVISIADPNKRSADLKRSKFEKRTPSFFNDPAKHFVPRAAAVGKQHERVSMFPKPKSVVENKTLSEPKSQSDFRKMMLGP